ncbi:hypothetical protein ABL78_3651 [Leptomonas seymouri]|uniref:Uncharacterized protein n=1 Tax=Leptomonas seymouri TaxID=5684 RepID=A0A0N0P660_LEPSE|nr:hypothetical protein ABL78_3651 [Leptomonas seymouri]|eukprot:KPI87256.1 hypothetical protein ABL78_3651 [Leptomonas seymouri]
MTEVHLHAPLCHAHCGRRTTSSACDEFVLEAAWPAEAVVGYVLLPPLREVVEVHFAKLGASSRVAPTAARRGHEAVPSCAISRCPVLRLPRRWST